jgi:hypothetical protein
MNYKLIIYIIIIVALGIAFFHPENIEGNDTGALSQLQAKGPQDTYLSGDAWKYIPWWYYGPYADPTYGPTYSPFRPTYVGKYPYYNRYF